MRHTRQNWLWLLLVILAVAASSFAAETSPRIVYAGGGTTLNGNLLYYAAPLQPGDKVQTGGGGTKMTISDAEVELSGNTIVIMGNALNSLELVCGQLNVTAGTVSVVKGSENVTLTAGQSTSVNDSSACGTSLPDAPSALADSQQPPAPMGSRARRQHSASVPAPGRGGLRLENPSLGASYWALTGAMFASSIVNAEYANKCIDQNSCTSIPDPFRSRAAMYGAGLPAEAGVAYITAYLKGKGKRWWFVPEVAVTAANAYVAYHWSTRLR
jgi:hypothetical protein